MMRTNLHPSPIALILLLYSSAAVAQDFAPQKRRDAVRSAKTSLAGLESPGKCPTTIVADPDRAVGVVIRPQTSPFFLFVPQKDLEKTDFQGKEIRKGYGAPVGYLFPGWTPEVDGQLVDPARRAALFARMRHAVTQDPTAGKLILDCLVLTASRKEDEGYVLHALGTSEEPLFSVPLEKTAKPETSVVVKDFDLKKLRLKLDLSFGDGWRATIPFGTFAHP
jgi:hypothetical protein